MPTIGALATSMRPNPCSRQTATHSLKRAWAEIMQDLDAHDVLRRRLSVPLRTAWQAQEDIGWALRVVEATDEGLLPMQLTLLPLLSSHILHQLSLSIHHAFTSVVGINRREPLLSIFSGIMHMSRMFMITPNCWTILCI